MYYPSPIPHSEMEARRAFNEYHWLHWHHQRWKPNFPVTTARGWTIRIVRVRKPFVFSVASRGNRARKVHRVREVFELSKEDMSFRYTRYLCGGSTWAGNLRWETRNVCALCELTYQGKSAGVVKPQRKGHKS